jgi:hypothetical protein
MTALAAERERVERLKRALRQIADGEIYDSEGEGIAIPLIASQAQAVARAALSESGETPR